MICQDFNDSMTKTVYHKYVVSSFNKYDVVIFVVDVYSSLNTSDEIDILKLILNGMKNNKEQYGVDSKLIILLNKCDELEYDRTTKKYIPSDVELQGMVDQVKKIVTTLINELYTDALVDIMCVSCEDAYIYRMYSRDPATELDAKYLNKFGANEYGKTRWNKLTDSKKKYQIKKLFKEFDYDDRIKHCGFAHFKKSLASYLTKDKQYDIIACRIKYELTTYIDSNAYNGSIDIRSNIHAITNYEYALTTLQEQFGKLKQRSLIEQEFHRFFNCYKTKHAVYFNNYKITSNAGYIIVLSIKEMLTIIMDSFSYSTSVKLEITNDYTNIVESINTYLIEIIQCGTLFDETVDKLILLKDNKCDNAKLIATIFNRFCHMPTTFADCASNEAIIVKRLQFLVETFNIPYNQHMIMVYTNLLNYIGHNPSTVTHKYAYISSLFVSITNPHYTQLCVYKSMLIQRMEDATDTSDVNIFTYSTMNNDYLDVYFMFLLQKKYDVVSVDDIIDMKKYVQLNRDNRYEILKNDEDTDGTSNGNDKDGENNEDYKNDPEASVDAECTDSDDISDALDRELHDSDASDSDTSD